MNPRTGAQPQSEEEKIKALSDYLDKTKLFVANLSIDIRDYQEFTQEDLNGELTNIKIRLNEVDMEYKSFNVKMKEGKCANIDEDIQRLNSKLDAIYTSLKILRGNVELVISQCQPNPGLLGRLTWGLFTARNPKADSRMVELDFDLRPGK